MNILIYGEDILALDPTETSEAWVSDGNIVPKHIAFDAQIIDIELPADFSATAFRWNGQDLERRTIVEIEPVPQSVTMRQARLALLNKGMLGNVNVAINSMPSPQKEAAQIEWEFSSVVERHRPITVMLGSALGLSELDLNKLFIDASKL